jgi:hypothetical protein
LDEPFYPRMHRIGSADGKRLTDGLPSPSPVPGARQNSRR